MIYPYYNWLFATRQSLLHCSNKLHTPQGGTEVHVAMPWRVFILLAQKSALPALEGI